MEKSKCCEKCLRYDDFQEYIENGTAESYCSYPLCPCHTPRVEEGNAYNEIRKNAEAIDNLRLDLRDKALLEAIQPPHKQEWWIERLYKLFGETPSESEINLKLKSFISETVKEAEERGYAKGRIKCIEQNRSELVAEAYAKGVKDAENIAKAQATQAGADGRFWHYLEIEDLEKTTTASEKARIVKILERIKHDKDCGKVCCLEFKEALTEAIKKINES